MAARVLPLFGFTMDVTLLRFQGEGGACPGAAKVRSHHYFWLAATFSTS